MLGLYYRLVLDARQAGRLNNTDVADLLDRNAEEARWRLLSYAMPRQRAELEAMLGVAS